MVTNCTITGNNVGGIIADSNGTVNYCRIFNNTVYDGYNFGNSSCNIDFNWWGQNNITSLINGSLPNSYYQIELSANNQVSTRYLNTSANGTIPVPLAYKMCLNGSNNTGNISNLPDFNATIKLNNNTGLFKGDIDLFGFSPFMSPGDSDIVSAKNPWNDTINNRGNYTFSALVDNQQLNISLAAEKANASLSLIASNITYGDNTSIAATLTSNGTGLSNKNLTFDINGIYTATTNGSGVAVLNNISGLHAGSYNVSVIFNGDADYNPSTNNTIFSVAKMDTSLVINKTVNATNVYVGDLISYTINVKNLGTNPVTSIKVNDTLPGSLEFINSTSNNSGSSGIPYLWNIPLLSSGETATLNITCKVKESGIIKNTASLIINNYENNLTNSSSVDIVAEKMNTSLSIVKTVNSTNPVVGDLVGYTIKVMNNGTNNISTPILVKDNLPEGLEYVGSSASVGSYSHSSGLWNITSGLNIGDTVTLNISVRVKTAGNLINNAYLVLDDYNNNQTNDSSVGITVKPNGSGGNGTDGSGSDNGGNGGFDGLAKTGLPLIFLLLLSVLGVYYLRRK